MAKAVQRICDANEICRKRMEKFLAESRLEFFKKQRVYLPVGMLTGVVMIILLV